MRTIAESFTRCGSRRLTATIGPNWPSGEICRPDVHLGHAARRDARGEAVLPDPHGLSEGVHRVGTLGQEPAGALEKARWPAPSVFLPPACEAAASRGRGEETMRRISRWVLAAALLSGLASQASSPCWSPQVSLSPGMNATAMRGTFTLTGADPKTALRIEAEDGTMIDPASFTGSFAAPGWYTVHVTVPPRGLESSDRSLVQAKDEFWAEVLVGRSEPGIARIDRCFLFSGDTRRNVMIRWSEPVQFAGEPLQQVELVGDAGVPLSCRDRLASADGGYDGGFLTQLSLDCPDEEITAVRVIRAPRSASGVAAVFPPEGIAWEATAWAGDAYVGSVSPSSPACRVWQPSVRQRTHENVSASGLGPNYEKCGPSSGCTCASSGSLGFFLAALLLSRARGRHAR